MASHPPAPHEEPFSESHLGSPEYRDRLMRKLNCLIAVLEVATAKVRKNMAGSPPDAERLSRICANLQSTLEVCQRARVALERRQSLPKAAAEPVAQAPSTLPVPAQPPKPIARPAAERRKQVPARSRPSRRGRSDFASEAERKRFAKMPPIDRWTILKCDLEDLARRLSS
jgi:hypothetical protein